jgi:hypothetical protein
LPRPGSSRRFRHPDDFLYNIWLYALKKPGDEFPRDPKKTHRHLQALFLRE